jgi:hypothetical protein
LYCLERILIFTWKYIEAEAGKDGQIKEAEHVTWESNFYWGDKTLLKTARSTLSLYFQYSMICYNEEYV